MENELDLVDKLTMTIQVPRMKYIKTKHLKHTFVGVF